MSDKCICYPRSKLWFESCYTLQSCWGGMVSNSIGSIKYRLHIYACHQLQPLTFFTIEKTTPNVMLLTKDVSCSVRISVQLLITIINIQSQLSETERGPNQWSNLRLLAGECGYQIHELVRGPCAHFLPPNVRSNQLFATDSFFLVH